MMENADALEAVHKNAAGTCPERGIEGALIPVSYTHLTLPTILLV